MTIRSLVFYTVPILMTTLNMPVAASPNETGTPTPLVPTATLVTDRSGASDAAGPTAIKWGFMCSIAARHGDTLGAINFTRTPDVAWDSKLPNEAPVALWQREAAGGWTSTLLDSPKRTYQTPSLLLGPDGRANVFTLAAGGDTIYWFHGDSPKDTKLRTTAIPMDWGAYLGGGIDAKGRALLVYWAGYHPDKKLSGTASRDDGYSRSTIGYTLVDTISGKHQNGIIDTPGAPYCYSQVAYAPNGAHVLTVQSIVAETLVCGSRNHYTELRYYYSPDPWSKSRWKKVVIRQNPRSLLQPLGLEVDATGRAHLLYYQREEKPDGQGEPMRLMYAVSRQPLSAGGNPEFVQHELKADGWDGRLFQTRGGRLFVLAYRAGKQAELAEVVDGVSGKVTPWKPVEMPVGQCRIFPISQRGGSTLTDDIEGVFLGIPGSPEQSNMYHFRLPVGTTNVAAGTR